jgi:hypothetical protein
VIKFEPGTRFACVALANARDVDLPSVSTPGDPFVVLRELPFDLGSDWRPTLGTFRTERLQDSDFLIFASQRSPYLNERHRDPLIRQVRAFYYALMMLGGPAHEPGLLFAGGVTSTGPNVLHAQDIVPALPRPLGHPPKITTDVLNVAADISAGVVAIQERRLYDRLGRGFWTWVGAIREQHLHVRLHQFVRSIDALIDSEAGKGKAQFVSRGQTFADGADIVQILSQLYRLRSVEEHFRPWEPIIGVSDPKEAERIGALRAYQAERLASHVYAVALAHTLLREQFRDEDSIASFWALGERERHEWWPSRLDMSVTEAEHEWRPELLRDA